MSKKRIVKASLDGIECVVLRVWLTSSKFELLKAAHYSEVYVKGNGIPINEWAGRSVLERRQLAVFLIGRKWENDKMGELPFFAKMPELRCESIHPEWGEPSGRHYAIPLNFPVSKVVLFAEELGHDDSGD